MADPIVIAYFVRHGQTVLNADNCFRGNVDVELNDKGRRDAHKIAKLMAPIDLSVIFYSDKKRSTETAKILAEKHPDTGCFGTPNLWAWNVGTFSGQPKDAKNKTALERYIQNPDIPIPEGESLNEFKARVRPCISEAMEVANQMGDPSLCVVHSSVIHEVGCMLKDDHNAVLVEPGGVIAVFALDGKIGVQPVHKPLNKNSAERADNLS